MLVQLQWSLQFVIRFIWPSSAKRCQEEIGEMEKGAGGLLRNIEIRAFSGGFLRLSSIPLNENTGGAVGSGGGFEDVIHRMIAFQRLYGATKLATFNTTDRQRLLWKKKMPRSSEKGLTSSKVAQFEAE